MKAISVKGVTNLKGKIEIQGSKNTVLPIISASILTTGITKIYNCPVIDDVIVMCQLLNCLGVKTHLENHILEINTKDIHYASLPIELTCKLRSSVLLLGPLIARFHKATIGMPGGCAIGARPIDIHLDGFSHMNVDISSVDGYLSCKCFHLQGCDYSLRFASVGATENLLMAAAGATGRTILRGVAKEPEIVELCKYLVSIGVVIEGIGTDTLIIKGTHQFVATDFENPYDRIVAGTYILMSAAIPSDIRLYGIKNVQYISNVIEVVKSMGVVVVPFPDYLCIHSTGAIEGGDYVTGIYPDFPTDLQPLLITVLMKSTRRSSVTETVFENRLGIVSSLQRIGGNVYRKENVVFIEYSDCLCGHTVKAMDLRQGAALVVAGLLCKGYTTITDIIYIMRGYEDIVRDLKCLGVEIEYI
ncbi:MAG: UDP-N-acetylglucosamine 1-carboxyvinyltransferase [Lachnospiraceae bacterium]